MQIILMKGKKLLWFIGLWLAGILGLTLLSYSIKLLMFWAGLHT